MSSQLFKEAILFLVVSAAYSKSKIRTSKQKIHIQHKHTIHFQSHKSEYQPYHLINYLGININLHYGIFSKQNLAIAKFICAYFN